MQFPVLAESEHESGLKAVTPGPTITWDETIPWLRRHAQMEIWLKGVYTPADTQLTIDHNLDGIVVSNHGVGLGGGFLFSGEGGCLRYDGEKGVDLAIRLIREELRRMMMMLTECRTVEDISLEQLAVLVSDGLLARL